MLLSFFNYSSNNIYYKIGNIIIIYYYNHNIINNILFKIGNTIGYKIIKLI